MVGERKGVSDGLKGLLQETLESEMVREEKKRETRDSAGCLYAATPTHLP